MNWTLQNFPGCCEPNHHLPHFKKEDCPVFEWFQGIKAELQKKLKKARKNPHALSWRGFVLKEMLGE